MQGVSISIFSNEAEMHNSSPVLLFDFEIFYKCIVKSNFVYGIVVDFSSSSTPVFQLLLP
jgi:hypothetical protein